MAVTQAEMQAAGHSHIQQNSLELVLHSHEQTNVINGTRDGWKVVRHAYHKSNLSDASGVVISPCRHALYVYAKMRDHRLCVANGRLIRIILIPKHCWCQTRLGPYSLQQSMLSDQCEARACLLRHSNFFRRVIRMETSEN